MRQLRAVELEGNCLDDDGLAQLAGLIAGKDGYAVVSLNVSRNLAPKAGTDGQEPAYDCLTDFTPLTACTSLTTLKLDGSKPTAASIAAIAGMGLSRLSLADCGLTFQLQDDLVVPALTSSGGSLAYLDISGNALDAGITSATHFRSLLKLSPASAMLFMDRMKGGLSDEQIVGLFSALPRSDGTKMAALSLCNNNISNIVGLPPVDRLHLSHNRVTSLMPLVNTAVRYLYVEHNRLTDLFGVPQGALTIRADSNAISTLRGLDGCAVTQLSLQDNLLTDLSAVVALAKDPAGVLEIVKVDRNRLSFAEGSPCVDELAELQSLNVKVTYADQVAADFPTPDLETPESPEAPPVQIGGADISSTLLLSTKSATRGSLVTVRATCTNEGDTDLGAHKFQVVFNRLGIVEVQVPEDTQDDPTLLEAESLAAGETEELFFTFRVPESYDRDDPIQVLVQVTPVDENGVPGVPKGANMALLHIYYINLSVPEVVFPKSTFKVYGEATVNSTVTIYDADTFQALATTRTTRTNRWYTAQVTVPDGVDTLSLWAEVAPDSDPYDFHASETVTVQVNNTDAAFRSSSIFSESGREYGPNTYVGFPTLCISLPVNLEGPYLKSVVTLENPEQVKDFKFTFLGKDYEGTYDPETKLFTCEIPAKWKGTGVQRLTMTVTQQNDVVRAFTAAQFTLLVDPSGYVTDGDNDNAPLPGVEVTLEEMYVEGGQTKWRVWDGASYLQQNPVYTDETGHYGWDVPEGTYRLQLKLDDYVPVTLVQYETASGKLDTLTVLPVRTDVDVTMRRTTLYKSVAPAEAALDALTWDNDLTADAVLAAVTEALEDFEGVTASWEEAPVKTDATTEAAGSFSGTLVLTDGDGAAKTIEITKELPQLTGSGNDDTPGGGNDDNPGGGNNDNPGGGNDDNPGGGNNDNPGGGNNDNPGGGSNDNPGGGNNDNTGGGSNDNTGSGSGNSGSGSTGSGGGKRPVTTKPQEPAQPALPDLTQLPKFLDVPDTYWASGDIVYMASQRLFMGVGDDLFDPEGTMTRGMMVTLLGRMAKADVTWGGEFTDVDPLRYYAPYVSWAYQTGITSGAGDGLFAPERLITRQEICTLVAKYLGGARLPQGTLDDFADADQIASWARPAVASLHALGVVNGMGDGIFAPTGLATRAQCAAILHRVLVLPGE